MSAYNLDLLPTFYSPPPPPPPPQIATFLLSLFLIYIPGLLIIVYHSYLLWFDFGECSQDYLIYVAKFMLLHYNRYSNHAWFR